MAEQELEILKIKAKAFDILKESLDIYGNYIEAIENCNGESVTIDLDLNRDDFKTLNKALKL